MLQGACYFLCLQRLSFIIVQSMEVVWPRWLPYSIPITESRPEVEPLRSRLASLTLTPLVLAAATAGCTESLPQCRWPGLHLHRLPLWEKLVYSFTDALN